MPSNDSHRAVQVDHEAEAWEMRKRGWTVRRIAAQLGLSPSTVSRMLARVERRALRALTKRVEHQKVTSTHILDEIRDEALQAWEKSKKDRLRAVKKTSNDGTVNVQEATNREGDVSYLNAAMLADDRIRRIWGIDTPPAKPVDETKVGLSVSAYTARVLANEANHADDPDDSPPHD